MAEVELRPARPEEFDAVVRLVSTAGLPVQDLEVVMLDAFVVATDGEVCVGVVGLEIYESNALSSATSASPSARAWNAGPP